MIPETIWDHFLAAGGLGMVPTAIDGFLLVASAVLLVRRPERRFVPLVICLGLLTLGGGLLGTVVGMVSTLHYLATIPPSQMAAIACMGAAEALHCLVLALMAVVAALFLSAIAAWRSSRLPPVD